jgi:hypothetical protein
MRSEKSFSSDAGIEPIAISVEDTVKGTGESRSQVYKKIARGQYEAVKSGSRTLIIYESIKRHFASLPRAKVKPPKPRAT